MINIILIRRVGNWIFHITQVTHIKGVMEDFPLLLRDGVPALKYLLKQGVEFGKDLYQYFRAGKTIPEAIKTSAKKRVSSALKDLDEHINPNQTGSGLRKKPRFHIPKKISKKKSIRKIKKSKRKRKSKSKDIFI